MTRALFRLRLPDGENRLASGDPDAGPDALLPRSITLDDALSSSVELGKLLADVDGGVPPGSVVLAPVESQEVWAAGVTYERSRAARIEESVSADPYDLVDVADRPELFFKAPGWRVRGAGEPIGIRADSDWNVPEPELALVVASDLSIAGYVIGNDVSSRSIEGRNTLYLPQAKVYDGACALGPCIVPTSEVAPPFPIGIEIDRNGDPVFAGRTSTAEMRRSFDELVVCLGAALSLPVGAILLTGTGIVPDAATTLLPGDVVRIEIGSLGALENRVEVVGSRVVGRVEEART
jgi:2-dehydro-3-deoxy-D-arabinonate dehydratase